MTPTYQLIKSRTFWTLVVAGLLPVANAIVPTLSPAVQDIATIILSLVAMYFHIDGVKSFGAKVEASKQV